MDPPPDQTGSREGFITETFLTNVMIRREALKCTLLQNTFQHKGIPLRSAWLRVARPSVRPLYLVTSSHIGVSYPSPDTPHTSRIFSRKSAATIPAGFVGDGEGGASPTPTATTPWNMAAKSWTVASNSPKSASPCAKGGTIVCTLPPYVPPPPKLIW